MKITIKTQSPLLCSTGESSALIDADVKYDKFGFPNIQAKTFKGVLRESAVEVCEMLGLKYFHVENLFGQKGNDNTGKLRFNNLFLKGYNEDRSFLKEYPDILNPSFVKSHYTTTIQQTSINDGVAKDKSLRKYRLIIEDTDFETIIENVSETEKEFLKLALLNLRYIGTRRNRGFGKVKMHIDNQESISEPALIPVKIKYNAGKNDSAIYKLTFNITTLEPVVIAKIFGEQNTVSTVTNIPAQLIRGLLASLIIKNEALVGKSVSTNSLFRQLILDNQVGYYSAFIGNSNPIPKAYGFDKTVLDSPLEIIFGKKKPLKGQTGYGYFDDEKCLLTGVATIFSFHHSRYESRLAGRSTEEQGSIFYYEGIHEDQVFSAQITGSLPHLNYIEELLKQNNGEHYVGKARSAQYAKIRISNFKTENLLIDDLINSPVYMVFHSPVITHNQYGVAIPNLEILKQELEATGDISISNIQIASSLDWVENYIGIWNSKTSREAAFDIGTTLRIEFTGKINKYKLELNGLGERKSEGYGRIKLVVLPENIKRISNNIKGVPHKDPIQDNTFPKKGLLFDVYEKQQKQEKENRMLIKAIDFARPFTEKLPNSLLSKLRNKLDTCKNIDQWKIEMDHIKGKKANRTLEDVDLWDSVQTLKCPQVLPSSFDEQQKFWEVALKTMRKKKTFNTEQNGN